MTIGERIREKRKNKNYTLEQLADEIGVTKSTVLKYENGSIAIPSDKIEKIAKALKTTPAYLMGWADNIWNDRKLCEITLPNGNIFDFIENDGKIRMRMKESNFDRWQEFQFDEYEQREFEKVMGMNMLFFNGKEVAPEDKIELEKVLLTIFIKAYFNHKK